MSDLYLAEIYLSAPDLVRLGNAKGFPRTQTTQNYLVHAAMGELFGEHSPKPFWIDPQSADTRQIRVLGYTDAPQEALLSHAEMFATPSRYKLLDKNNVLTKKMPSLMRGLTLSFDTWAVPTIRKGSAGSVESPSGQTYSWVEGQEVDYFLDRTWHEGEDVTRPDAYDRWVQHQFDVRDTGAKLQGPTSISAFKEEQMSRRSHDKTRIMKTLARRPVAAFHGTVAVTDPAAFQNFLASGIGRHKTFGYGMMKLRAA